jgi:hypothetical protein
MAKFLNTSATNDYLEELIKASSERPIIISPFLKFNDRICELLEDKEVIFGVSLGNPAKSCARSAGCDSSHRNSRPAPRSGLR